MLYPKNRSDTLSHDLFRSPTAEYRSAPFWSWNCRLDNDTVVEQCKVFAEMGCGGYHMHVRMGLETEYLGKDFLDAVEHAVETAKAENLKAWLYDEDRWPSGFAGGLLTKNPRYRLRHLTFTTRKQNANPVLDKDGTLLDGVILLARYKLRFKQGKLVDYRRLADDEKSTGIVWYAYLCMENTSPRFNHGTRGNVLSAEAMNAFADITYNKYRDRVGQDFGDNIYSMFTDEPEFYMGNRVTPIPILSRGHIPWTEDMDTAYSLQYGSSLLDALPEVFFDSIGGKPTIRYRYFDFVAERFATAFADTLGRRCRELGLELTGHLMREETLHGQTISSGECMRHYRSFGMPGIDMLCSHYEFTTAKQTQSAVHQYGREGMLSELYGVSRWDYLFSNYKIHGDWQAALGVSVRVPHLSLMSMRGEAKRDYPASIFYQSAWYRKYALIENHFARVNTAMTRGTPIVDLAVVHPIESYWLLENLTTANQSAKKKAEEVFQQTAEWLLRDTLDFDYICEATLPEQCAEGGYPLAVGNMRYRAVVLSHCATIRSTTLTRLIAFARAGGRVLITGDRPRLVDGAHSNALDELFSVCEFVDFAAKSLCAALEQERIVSIEDERGDNTDNIVYQLRRDGERLWLFLARANHKPIEDVDHVIEQHLTITICGEYEASLWNTMDGEVSAQCVYRHDGKTTLYATMYNHDSLLYAFDVAVGDTDTLSRKAQTAPVSKVALEGGMRYELSEPNALLLDRARYSLDGSSYSLRETELLRASTRLRGRLGLPQQGGGMAQPWVDGHEQPTHTLALRFEIYSDIEYDTPHLALEDAAVTRITFNGQAVPSVTDGYYVDKSIECVALPPLRRGKNVLVLHSPFGRDTYVEWCYLLGDFGVRVEGASKRIVALPSTLTFGDLCKQGLPFFGGAVTYHTTYTPRAGHNAVLRMGIVRAVYTEACVSGREYPLSFAPYTADMGDSTAQTTLDITAYVGRENSFGAAHYTRITNPNTFLSPVTYRRNDAVRRYVLCETGLLTPPTIEYYAK